MYEPTPKITALEQDASLESLCGEILGLTKKSWNMTQMATDNHIDAFVSGIIRQANPHAPGVAAISIALSGAVRGVPRGTAFRKQRLTQPFEPVEQA